MNRSRTRIVVVVLALATAASKALAVTVVVTSTADLVTMRMGQLEEDLNLRPDQRGAWKVYRDRVMQMLDDQRRAARAATAYSAIETSAPKRLDALADAARNRLTAVEDIVDAGKALYASLTPEQRTLADRRLALPLATLSGSDTGADLLPRALQRPQAGVKD